MNNMSTDCMSMNIMTMFIISIIAGLFVTMNIWVYKFSHIRLLHINDIYMILLMTVLMTFISIIYMNHKIDKKIWIILLLMIIILFFLIRNQILVDDTQYLRGMIPHHSMAILMSEKIKEKTKNPKVMQLANQIIESQTKEIDIINDILKSNNQNLISFQK